MGDAEEGGQGAGGAAVGRGVRWAEELVTVQEAEEQEEEEDLLMPNIDRYASMQQLPVLSTPPHTQHVLMAHNAVAGTAML